LGLNRTYTPIFEVVLVWRLARIGQVGDHTKYLMLGDPRPKPANTRVTRLGRAGADPPGGSETSSSAENPALMLIWDRSAETVGYESLLWRTRSAPWEQVAPVGNVTGRIFARQLDDE
jgi:hypothetical protein